MLYRTAIHLADSDEQAMNDLAQAAGAPRISYALSNQAVDNTAANAGYYGRDTETQRARLAPHDLQERIELGQLLVGSPDAVFQQICAIQKELGAGILEVSFSPVGLDKVRHAVELFGERVLPRMHELPE